MLEALHYISILRPSPGRSSFLIRLVFHPFELETCRQPSYHAGASAPCCVPTSTSLQDTKHYTRRRPLWKTSVSHIRTMNAQTISASNLDLSPIDRLPDEIVEEIFMNLDDAVYSAHDREQRHPALFEDIQLPYVRGILASPSLSSFCAFGHRTKHMVSHPATRTCSRWRNISLQSRFTSSITWNYGFSVTEDFLETYASNCDGLLQWLPTTGLRSLKMKVYFSEGYRPECAPTHIR
jgi:hypothetical protein